MSVDFVAEKQKKKNCREEQNEKCFSGIIFLILRDSLGTSGRLTVDISVVENESIKDFEIFVKIFRMNHYQVSVVGREEASRLGAVIVKLIESAVGFGATVVKTVESVRGNVQLHLKFNGK